MSHITLATEIILKLKKYLSKAVSLLFILIGLRGLGLEIRNILIVYPRLAHHLSKVNVTTDIYDNLVRNSVYMTVAHLLLSTLGVAMLVNHKHHSQKYKFILGSLIIIIAYAATKNFKLPTEAHEYLSALLEGLLFSRH